MLGQVIHFNVNVLGIQPRPIGFMPENESEHLVKAMLEEIDEFHTAHSNGDLIGSIDGLCDLIYFAMGGLHKLGLSEDLANKIFTEIHNANMEKRLGRVAKRDTGAPDAVKPENWVSPEARIAAILDEHISG